MLEAVVSAALLGLSAGSSPGPLMFLVISVSLSHGAKEGFKAALAPLITDLPIIVVALFLMTRLSQSGPLLGAVSLAGGLFVIYLGWGTVKTEGLDPARAQSDPKSVRKGALVNFLSPHPYLFWFAIGAPRIVALSADGWGKGAGFIASFYICLIGSKMVAAILFAKARSIVVGRPYIYTMRLLGLLLIGYGLILLKDALVGFGVWGL